MNRTILQRENVQVVRSFKVLDRPTGIPKGLKKGNSEGEGRGLGVSDFGIRRARGG